MTPANGSEDDVLFFDDDSPPPPQAIGHETAPEEAHYIANATILSIAGRQRTLCQRVVKDLLAEFSDIRREKGAMIQVMRDTYRALEEGGLAPTTRDPDGPTVMLPPAPSDSTREAARSARLTVELLSHGVLEAFATPREERKKNIEYVLYLSDALFEAAESVVEAYTEFFAEQERVKAEAERLLKKHIEEVVGRLRLVAADMQGMIAELREVARTLNEAAREQESLAGSLAEQATLVRGQASEIIGATQHLTQAISEVRTDVTASSACVVETQTLCEGAQGAMTRLHERAQSIDKSIAIVEDVCTRTKLLALNARIEAARAGQAGAGFRVVADEVKALASESSTASQTIDHDLGQVRDETSTTLGCVKDVVGAMGTVAGLSQKTTASIEHQIAMAEEMSASIRATARAANSISEAAATYASAVTQTAERASSVNEVSVRLINMSAEIGALLHELRH